MADYKCHNCGVVEERRPRKGEAPMCSVCNSGMYYHRKTERGPNEHHPTGRLRS